MNTIFLKTSIEMYLNVFLFINGKIHMTRNNYLMIIVGVLIYFEYKNRIRNYYRFFIIFLSLFIKHNLIYIFIVIKIC